MEVVPVVMRILNKNEKFLHIQEQIDARMEMILQKYKGLSKVCETNEYLDGIQNDYSKHYNVIVQQKQDQIKALEVLDAYIERIKESSGSNIEKLDEMKLEHGRILKEISILKENLD
jgi:predicted  nucleic acid-binding Zn-ribbon protein